MISDILPSAVMAAEATEDDEAADPLPEEAALVGNAVESRRREFITGRACARRALARLHVSAGAILAGPRREPLWPPGVVGSITHCRGYRAAAVARAGDLVSIGIDAEVNGPLPGGVLDTIAVPAEKEWIGASGDQDEAALGTAPDGAAWVHWDRLLFSAKESVFKAWYPLTGEWLDFTEARVSFTPAADTVARGTDARTAVGGRRLRMIGGGRFVARLLVPGPSVAGRRIEEFPGRYLVAGGLVLTAVALSASVRP